MFFSFNTEIPLREIQAARPPSLTAGEECRDEQSSKGYVEVIIRQEVPRLHELTDTHISIQVNTTPQQHRNQSLL